MTNPVSARTKIKYFLTAALLAVMVGYTSYQMRGLIGGPRIIVDLPTNGSSLAAPLVTIRGRAEQVTKLFLNGEKLTPDSTGRFESQLLLAEGYNIIRLDGEDRFGRRVEKKLELVFN